MPRRPLGAALVLLVALPAAFAASSGVAGEDPAGDVTGAPTWCMPSCDGPKYAANGVSCEAPALDVRYTSAHVADDVLHLALEVADVDSRAWSCAGRSGELAYFELGVALASYWSPAYVVMSPDVSVELTFWPGEAPTSKCWLGSGYESCAHMRDGNLITWTIPLSELPPWLGGAPDVVGYGAGVARTQATRLADVWDVTEEWGIDDVAHVGWLEL